MPPQSQRGGRGEQGEVERSSRIEAATGWRGRRGLPRVGDTVTVNWHGVGDWVSGTVVRENSDGSTVMVEFTDGSVEHRVPCKRILECIRAAHAQGKPFWWVLLWRKASKNAHDCLQVLLGPATQQLQNLPSPTETWDALGFLLGMRARRSDFTHGVCGKALHLVPRSGVTVLLILVFQLAELRPLDSPSHQYHVCHSRAQ